MITNLSAQILVQPWRWWVVIEGYGPVPSNDFKMKAGALTFTKDIPNLHNPTNISLWVLGQGGTVQGAHVRCAVAFGANPPGPLNPLLDVAIPAGDTSAHQGANYPLPGAAPANILAANNIVASIAPTAKKGKKTKAKVNKSNKGGSNG